MTMLENVVDFFISSAHADTVSAPTAAQPGGNFAMPIILVMFVLFIYFTVWRPQNKRAKEQRNMLSSLAMGDEVVTAGGLMGKIVKISDSYMVLSVSDNVQITMQKSSVANVLPKGTLKAI